MDNTSSIQIWSAILTKNGNIALWEKGGSRGTIGAAMIIAQKDGSKPRAAFINRPGTTTNGEHALVVVDRGYYIIKSSHDHETFEHDIYKVLRAFVQNGKAFVEVRLTHHFAEGKWSNDLAQKLNIPVKTAQRKALAYHCREPFYVKKPKNF